MPERSVIAISAHKNVGKIDEAEYLRLYEQSLADPDRFWGEHGWSRETTWGREVKVPASALERLRSQVGMRIEGCRAVKEMTNAVPLARWFRGPLRGRVREALTGDRLSSTGMFDRRYLQELIDHHESGRRDYSAPLWTLLMFDAFLRNVMDGSTAVPVTEKAA